MICCGCSTFHLLHKIWAKYIASLDEGEVEQSWPEIRLVEQSWPEIILISSQLYSVTKILFAFCMYSVNTLPFFRYDKISTYSVIFGHLYSVTKILFAFCIYSVNTLPFFRYDKISTYNVYFRMVVLIIKPIHQLILTYGSTLGSHHIHLT